MNRYKLLIAAFCVIVLAGSITIAQHSKDDKHAGKPGAAGQPEMKLPPGITPEDMQACIAAMTPGEQHKYLAKNVGVWQGKSTMWMAPESEPMKTECTATFTPMLEGRYIKCEMAGEMPGMGPYNGFAIYGYDNVSKKFQSTWVDTCGTGMAIGTGDLSSDGKILTWNFTYHCPIAKKQISMREIETNIGPDSKTLVMYGPDKTGKEFKMMEITFTRKSGTGGTAAAPTGSAR